MAAVVVVHGRGGWCVLLTGRITVHFEREDTTTSFGFGMGETPEDGHIISSVAPAGLACVLWPGRQAVWD